MENNFNDEKENNDGNPVKQDFISDKNESPVEEYNFTTEPDELFEKDLDLNSPRQNYVTEFPDEEVENEHSQDEKGKSRGNRTIVFAVIGAIIILSIGLFFIFRGKSGNHEAIVKDNTPKFGVNASVPGQTDFKGDYQNRYGDNSNSLPHLNTNVNPGNYPNGLNGNYGTVGNITAPSQYNPNENIYQPGQMQQVPQPVQQNNGGGFSSSGGSTSGNSTKPVETTRINPDKNTQIVEYSTETRENNRNSNSGPNEQVSLYFYDRTADKNDEGRVLRIEYENNSNAVPRPAFGTVLPVKVLGRLHTLSTNGLARMELVRTVQGSWGTIPSGTMFVGRVAGGEGNRLFVSLIGYIDSRTNRLVTIGGDVQGKDGALGFEGDVKTVGSRWKKVFGELFSTVKEIGSAYLLGRSGGSGTIINNGNLSQLTNSLEKDDSARYTVVASGAQGYVVISDLPPALRSDERLADSKQQLSDEEILKMIQTESSNDLRKMIPQLSPQGRQIAQNSLENK